MGKNQLKQLRFIVSLFILILWNVKISAQESVEVFGYFESQGMGTVFNNQFYQLYSNKLRVDLKSELSDKVTFGANFDYITYHGKTLWPILDYLPKCVTDDVPDEMRPFYIFPFQDQYFLDNGYLRLTFRAFDLTVGKQQISLGTGYVWNPTDVFNMKDILDPTYEQPGHNGIRLDIPIGTVYTITTLYSPEETWNHSAKMIQFKGRISHFDYTMIGIEKEYSFHDYTRFDSVALGFLELSERRRLLGASTAGEVLGFGVWAEYGTNQMETTDDFYELVIGIDYTFDFQTYIMAEMYRNSLGKIDYQQYDLNDWMQLLTSEKKTITQDQIYCFIQHPITDFIQLGTSMICSISDGSLALVPTLNFSLTENVDVTAYVNVNIGKEGTTYSEDSGSGGLLRARVYF